MWVYGTVASVHVMIGIRNVARMIHIIVMWFNANSGLFVSLSLLGAAVALFHRRVVRPALDDFHAFALDMGEVRRVLRLELLPHVGYDVDEHPPGYSTLREDLVSIAQASVQHSDALREVLERLGSGNDRFKALDEGQARMQLEIANLRESLKDRDERIDVLHAQIQQFAAQLSAVSTTVHIDPAVS